MHMFMFNLPLIAGHIFCNVTALSWLLCDVTRFGLGLMFRASKACRNALGRGGGRRACHKV